MVLIAVVVGVAAVDAAFHVVHFDFKDKLSQPRA